MEQLAYAIENAIAYINAHPLGCLIMAVAVIVVSVFAYVIHRAERELNNPKRDEPKRTITGFGVIERQPIQHEILDEIHNN